jgi:hypothetical protein
VEKLAFVYIHSRVLKIMHAKNSLNSDLFSENNQKLIDELDRIRKK